MKLIQALFSWKRSIKALRAFQQLGILKDLKAAMNLLSVALRERDERCAPPLCFISRTEDGECFSAGEKPFH